MFKKVTPVTVAVALSAILILSACKKNTPTVVGNWQFSNYASTSQTRYAQGDSSNATVSYNSATQQLITIRQYPSGPFPTDTYTKKINYSNWNIMSNGTITVSESTDTNSTTSTGTWDYLSNNKANSGITFQNAVSVFAQPLPTSIFTIQSVTGNQLVLTNNSPNTYSAGQFAFFNDTLTFTK